MKLLLAFPPHDLRGAYTTALRRQFDVLDVEHAAGAKALLQARPLLLTSVDDGAADRILAAIVADVLPKDVGVGIPDDDPFGGATELLAALTVRGIGAVVVQTTNPGIRWNAAFGTRPSFPVDQPAALPRLLQAVTKQ